jgi:hypothetical protein
MRNIVLPSQLAGQDKKSFHCKAIEHVINSLDMLKHSYSMSGEKSHTSLKTCLNNPIIVSKKRLFNHL